MAVESLHIFTEYNSEQPMDELRYSEWQNPFREALLEIDREKLQRKMMKAEEAIFQRLQQLAGTSGSEAERQAIEDALASLRVLKRDNLGFPDWEKK
jgi:hypothetical protein